MSGFPNHDSQPSFELWRQSILAQLNASAPALVGGVRPGAGVALPDTGSVSDLADNLLHNRGV